MLIKRSLWKCYSRRARPVTAVDLVLVVFHVLLIQQEPYQLGKMQQWFFVVLHCVGLNWSVNSIGGSDGAFLCTRGFTRDALWNHRILVRLSWILLLSKFFGGSRLCFRQ